MDGVITTGDTFVRYMHTRAPRMRPRAAVRFVRSVHEDRRSGLPLTRRFMLVRASVLAALEGVPEQTYLAQVADLTSQWVKESGWIRWDVVEEMRERRSAGMLVVVATACEDRLAAALLEAAKVPYDVLSASVVDSCGVGKWVIRDYRIGEFKAIALERAGIELACAVLTTDSLTDLPTARRCQWTWVVCSPSSRLPNRLRAAGANAARRLPMSSNRPTAAE
ncbi:HAD family hydrolase [Dermacoccus nishinomiyaensis]